MFTYWQGYEIDGSSTAYNLFLPNRELALELFRYFLTLKIIDREAEITLSFSEANATLYHNHNKCKKKNFSYDTIAKIDTFLSDPKLNYFQLSITCVHPKRLYPQVREELFQLSRTRPGAEVALLEYRNPTISPFYQPNLEITLEIYLGKPDEVIDQYQPEGLIFNESVLIQNTNQPHFTMELICGSTFIYEYAAYINTKLIARFPEIGIDGGIDCAGGFIDGCTYAANLYDYERIILNTTEIATTIQHLLQQEVIELQKPSGKYGREFSACKNLVLYHLHNAADWNELYLEGKDKIIKGILSAKQEFTPEEYQTLVEKIATITLFNKTDFMHFTTCALKVSNRLAALSCINEAGRIWLEILIKPELREEFKHQLSLLNIAVKEE